MKNSILLIGGMDKARSLADSLIKRGYQVTLINNNHEDCEKLQTQSSLYVIYGDGTKPYVLEDAGAGDCEIAIALTSKDEDNLVACELCKKLYHVNKTVALVSDPKKTEFFTRMGVDKVVCAIAAVTGIIEQQAFMEEMANTVPIGEGRVQITEVTIAENSPAAGKKLKDITLPREVIIGCILRGESFVVPKGDSTILIGDQLVVISGNGNEAAALTALTGR